MVGRLRAGADGPDHQGRGRREAGRDSTGPALPHEPAGATALVGRGPRGAGRGGRAAGESDQWAQCVGEGIGGIESGAGMKRERINVGDYVRESGFGSFVEGRGLSFTTTGRNGHVFGRSFAELRQVDLEGRGDTDHFPEARHFLAVEPRGNGGLRNVNGLRQVGLLEAAGLEQLPETLGKRFLVQPESG